MARIACPTYFVAGRVVARNCVPHGSCDLSPPRHTPISEVAVLRDELHWHASTCRPALVIYRSRLTHRCRRSRFGWYGHVARGLSRHGLETHAALCRGLTACAWPGGLHRGS